MSNTGLSANSKNIKKFQLQQKGRNILLVILIVAPIAIGGFIYVIFQQYTDETNSAELVTDFDESALQTSNSQGTDSNLSTPTYVPETTPSNAGSSGSTSSNSVNSTEIPNGVTVAMNSIESNGIKGSSYIADTLDTSQIPNGSTVKFDRASWSSAGPSVGSVNVTLTASGTPYQGSVTFESLSGTWKVTGYSLVN